MINIVHKINYVYDKEVFLSPHFIRLAPYVRSHITPESYSLTVHPDHSIHWQQDVYGNSVARIDFKDKVRAISLDILLGVELKSYNPFNLLIDQAASSFPFQYPTQIHKALLPYLRINEQSPALTKYAERAINSHQEILGFIADLNRQLFQRIRYVERLEQGVQTCEQTLLIESGSCRDSAWLLVQILRQLGLASRFVSGYLVQFRQQETIADLHAWAEVFIPGAGWIGLDTTSGLLTSEGHIALAVGPTPGDVSPVDGTTEQCNSSIDYKISTFVS